MTRETGEGFAIAVLTGPLLDQFRGAKKARGDCRQSGRSAVRCTLAWVSGTDLYNATITVYYAARRNAVVWDDHYRIQWVDRHCWLASGHRERCAVHSRHR
jgi:hypothetical protein